MPKRIRRFPLNVSRIPSAPHMTTDDRVSRNNADIDHPACESLEDVHARRGLLLLLAYRFCWNRADAEDAVQNALLLATRKVHQLDDRSKLWSWVRSIVVTQCKELLRRGMRRGAVESSYEPPPKQDSDPLVRSELSGMVSELIKALPERQQTALVLRHLEDMSYAGIAEMKGVAQSTARGQVRDDQEGLAWADRGKSGPRWRPGRAHGKRSERPPGRSKHTVPPLPRSPPIRANVTAWTRMPRGWW